MAHETNIRFMAFYSFVVYSLPQLYLTLYIRRLFEGSLMSIEWPPQPYCGTFIKVLGKFPSLESHQLEQNILQ